MTKKAIESKSFTGEHQTSERTFNLSVIRQYMVMNNYILFGLWDIAALRNENLSV